VEEEAAWLRGRAAAVLADVPPLGLAAAFAAEIPAFALANFSWDWIYACMGFERSATRAAEAYRRAHTLLALQPAAPMPAFERTLELGTLGRTSAHDRDCLRAQLGVAPDERLALVAFREPNLCALPPVSSGVRYVRVDRGDAARSDVVAPPRGIEFIDLVGAADAVVAKAGYGIVGDTSACGTPLLYARREGFPEDDILARWLEAQRSSARVDARSLAAGTWLSELETLLAAPRPSPASQEGVQKGIELVASVLAPSAAQPR
jgi:L-arabinokinase